jgi:hypothetical protein
MYLRITTKLVDVRRIYDLELTEDQVQEIKRRIAIPKEDGDEDEERITNNDDLWNYINGDIGDEIYGLHDFDFDFEDEYPENYFDLLNLFKD